MTANARKRVLLLFGDLHVRVIDAETGQLVRELTFDASRDYRPLGRPLSARLTTAPANGVKAGRPQAIRRTPALTPSRTT